MRITILAVGTRGDVQPYVALGLGLQKAGYQVKLASLDIFQEFIISRGLNFAPVGSIPQKLSQKSQNKNHTKNLKFHGLFGRVIWWIVYRSILETFMANSWNVCQDAEAIIYSRLALPGYHIAEKLGIPCYAAYTNPLIPTCAFPNPLMTSDFNLNGSLNRLSHIYEEQLFWQFSRNKINKWRQETLNLPPLPITGFYSRQEKQQIPILHCYSESVLPKPIDWSDRVEVTGYWFLDRPSNWQPPAELINFLESGSPPVYIGFGSMKDTNPEALTKLVVAALAQSGQRGILLTGWGGISELDVPENVLVVNSVPHDWLFPQMAAVVHHGGAGTTSAGLRAGVPSIIIPFGVDQPFWGKRVFQLGVGAEPIPRKDLTVEKLATAIKTGLLMRK